MASRIRLFSSLTIPFLLLVLLCNLKQHEGAESTPGTRTRKFGKSPVFSLFNLKSKSKFWSESVIRNDFDDLEGSVSKDGKAAMYNFTSSSNLANYMKLSEIDSIYLSMPVNFIFIGFEGKGNHELKLGLEELERWFTKIDHIFEHTRIPPIGEIMTPFYKLNIEKNQINHIPLISHVNYNFSVHAVLLGEKVTSVIEYAIKTLSRKDDINNSRENETKEVMWQVDMDRMEYIFDTLINYLQIQDSYNIFILNPKYSDNNNTTRYGYRRGLSDSEINLLKENKTLQGEILKSESKKKAFLEIDRMQTKPLYYTRPKSNFAFTTTEDIDTIEWSKKSMEALESLTKFNEGKNDLHILLDKASQMVHGKKDGMNIILENELKSQGDLKGVQSDCLTDSFISQNRWAFIDLSAGPFTWGPSVGGEGVRTELSLPNVKSFKELSEEEAEEQLQSTIRERFSSFDQEHHAVDILLAEMDIYELFSFKHCKGRRTKLALCQELDERMRDINGELEVFRTGEEYSELQKNKAIDALKRMENWNLFTNTPEENAKYIVARDSFLAHLGSTLWGSMRHIIAPSISDKPYYYYEKVSFQLYFITQERVRSVKQLPVNLNALKEGLNSLILPSQKSMFTQHLVSLEDDTALTMAFGVAKHAAAVPVLLVNGTYRSTTRTFLDSKGLQYQLQRLNGHSSLKGEQMNKRGTLEVPVFWFIHSEPVLVLDKHYQAKSLSNMVLVVQSQNPSYETHLQCNGKCILSDLRNPIKAAVAATAEHLAGLLPLHLVYSHAHDTAIEDWAWSIGSNPMSITSQGWLISGFQSDTIARSYIITSLEQSIQVLNKAIQKLVAERTTDKGYRVFKAQERGMVEKYNSVIGLWRRISNQCGNLRYGEAVKLLSMLDEASHGFADSVNVTISKLHPVQCTRERKVSVQFDVTTIPAFVFVFVILWLLLRPRRAKPKMN